MDLNGGVSREAGAEWESELEGGAKSGRGARVNLGMGSQDREKAITYANFAEPNITAFCSEVLHAVESELTEVARVLAAAGDERERNVSVERTRRMLGAAWKGVKQTFARDTLASMAERGLRFARQHPRGRLGCSSCIFLFAKVRTSPFRE